MYGASFIILYYGQQIRNYFTNYHTTTCFDTIAFQMQLFITYYQQLHLKYLCYLARYGFQAP